MHRFLCAFSIAALSAPSAASAQIFSIQSTVGGKHLRFAVRSPGEDEGELQRWAPLVVVFAGAPGDDAAKRALESFGDLEEHGFRMVCLVRGEEDTKAGDLALWFAHLRKRYRIEQGGMHAAVGEAADPAIAAVLADAGAGSGTGAGFEGKNALHMTAAGLRFGQIAQVVVASHRCSCAARTRTGRRRRTCGHRPRRSSRDLAAARASGRR